MSDDEGEFVPGVLALAAKKLLRTAEVMEHSPERWEVGFTKGAIEELADAGRLRSVGGITAMYGLPVIYPEHPFEGPPKAVRLDIVTNRGGGNQWITTEELIRAALPDPAVQAGPPANPHGGPR